MYQKNNFKAIISRYDTGTKVFKDSLRFQRNVKNAQEKLKNPHKNVNLIGWLNKTFNDGLVVLLIQEACKI